MEDSEGTVEVTELSLNRLVISGSTDDEDAEGFAVGYIEEFKSVKGK
jgi:hypothetical protein